LTDSVLYSYSILICEYIPPSI